MKTIKSERLLLQPLQITDAKAMYSYARDPEVARFTSWTAHQSLADTQAFLEYILTKENWTPGQFRVVWGIHQSTNIKLIGTISFTQNQNAKGHLDYALARSCWGNGYITEAVGLVLPFVFNHLPDLQKVCSGCLAENIGSIRVLEKSGFHLVNRYISRREGKFEGEMLETLLFELER